MNTNKTITWQLIKGKGRGVIANRNIEIGEVIEICPVLLADIDDVFPDYVYEWDNEYEALCLGFGSLYNHSYNPNAHYHRDYTANLIIFVALQNIKEGDEILINYNGTIGNNEKVNFDVIETPQGDK